MSAQLIPVKGGYRISVSKGKIFPKLYRTEKAANKRLDELNRHDTSNK